MSACVRREKKGKEEEVKRHSLTLPRRSCIYHSDISKCRAVYQVTPCGNLKARSHALTCETATIAPDFTFCKLLSDNVSLFDISLSVSLLLFLNLHNRKASNRYITFSRSFISIREYTIGNTNL